MPETITLGTLCDRFEVDMTHAQQVGQLSVQLFEATEALHKLDEHYAKVAFTAGILHNVAMAGGRKKHHTRGEAIILEHELTNVPEEDRFIMAAATAFHRKRWKPERKEKSPSLQLLNPEHQQIALILAALVRIADGLDYSHTQTAIVAAWDINEDGVTVEFATPFFDIDGLRAREKVDMWEIEIGTPFNVMPYRDVYVP